MLNELEASHHPRRHYSLGRVATGSFTPVASTDPDMPNSGSSGYGFAARP